jgi:hypothetical protein
MTASAKLHETFLARWSRHKGMTTSRSRAKSGAALADTSRIPEAESSADDHLCQHGSHIAGNNVNDAAHVFAMRRLWLTDPQFGACDGLDVYCGDYSGNRPDGVADAPPGACSAGDVAADNVASDARPEAAAKRS